MINCTESVIDVIMCICLENLSLVVAGNMYIVGLSLYYAQKFTNYSFPKILPIVLNLFPNYHLLFLYYSFSKNNVQNAYITIRKLSC